MPSSASNFHMARTVAFVVVRQMTQDVSELVIATALHWILASEEFIDRFAQSPRSDDANSPRRNGLNSMLWQSGDGKA